MMEHISVSLRADSPAFANDFCDVLKLFYQVDAYGMDVDGETLWQQYEETDGGRGCAALEGRPLYDLPETGA